MPSDTPITELEIVVLACARTPVRLEELFDRVVACWASPAPAPTSTAWYAALMAVREEGLIDPTDPEVFRTTPRGHRLLQRALCGALGAPRASQPPGSLSFAQAMALADLLPVRTLVTVLHTRLDELDRQQRALATALRAAHARQEGELRVASLNLREGVLNAERAFLFTFLRDVEQGFVSLDDAPAVVADGVAVARA